MFLFSGLKSGNPVLHFAPEDSMIMGNADEGDGETE